MLVITNPETLEEQECRVVYMGDPGDKGQRVGIEFLTPAPRFWGVEFPSEPAIQRSEEHTSELQSPCNLVCRLLLEKKKKRHINHAILSREMQTSRRAAAHDRCCITTPP